MHALNRIFFSLCRETDVSDWQHVFLHAAVITNECLKAKTVTDDTGFSCIFNDANDRVSKHVFFKSRTSRVTG